MWHAAKSPCVGLIGQGETSAITALRGHTPWLGTQTMRHMATLWCARKINVDEKGSAYLSLAAAATDSVNPDVLGLDTTLLVEGHVLHELFPAHQSVYCFLEPQGKRG